MGDKSKIEWLRGRDGLQGASWNPIRARNKATGGVGHFCVHKTAACGNCYAERLQPRFQNPVRYAAQDRDKVDLFLDAEVLGDPLHWRRPRLIFVCSMTDLFLDDHADGWIDDIFSVMAHCPQHTFIVLTKRVDLMQAYLSDPTMREGLRSTLIIRDVPGLAFTWPLPNVWIGGSCHDQESANEIIPQILATPAAVRFISAEPLLGPMDLTAIDDGERDGTRLIFNALNGLAWDGEEAISGIFGQPDPHLDWVIVGGESGPGDRVRPMHPEWARALRDQCSEEGVPFFFKQWGEWAPHTVMPGGDLGGDVRAGRVRIVHPSGRSDVEVAEATGGRSTEKGSRYMACIGKPRTGRLLDGVEHNGMPAVRP